VPSIDTRQITTQVLVNDGQTVVLGGGFETEQRQSRPKRCRCSATFRVLATRPSSNKVNNAMRS
jgi:hypothetical protein